MLKFCVMLATALLCISTTPSVAQAAPRRQSPLSTNAIIPAVVQAVEDEVYDLREEGKYFLIDNQGSGDSKPATISVYISSEISNDGHGIAVYKLMPYGEVYRYFEVHEDGLVVLADDPHDEFKPSGGSMLTVYMSDEAVCDFITHHSIKSSFVVDPDVSAERLRQAIQRQIKRTGFSYRQRSEKSQKKR